MVDRQVVITLSDGKQLKSDLRTKMTNDTSADMLKNEAISGVNRLIGSNLTINQDQVNIQTVIDDAVADDYPNSSKYEYHNWGYWIEARDLARQDTLLSGRSELRVKGPGNDPDFVVNGKITNFTPELVPSDEGTAPTAVTVSITYDVLDAYNHNKDE